MIELMRVDDIDILMKWRREVLGCVFGTDPGNGLMAANKRFFQKHIAAGTHIAYIA